MKILKCDLCGNECSSFQTLSLEYNETISHYDACSGCFSIYESMRRKIDALFATLMDIKVAAKK